MDSIQHAVSGYQHAHLSAIVCLQEELNWSISPLNSRKQAAIHMASSIAKTFATLRAGRHTQKRINSLIPSMYPHVVACIARSQ